jgi:hypothetical protein
MNKAKIMFEAIFYISGSFILFIVMFFVTSNFITDSRVFSNEPNGFQEKQTHEAEWSEKSQKVEEEKENEKEKDEQSFQKYSYVRSEKVEKEIRDSYLADEENDIKKTKSDSGTTVEKYKVELINYSSIPDIESYISERLEKKGYIVKVSKPRTARRVDSVIIERKEGDVGNLIKRHLRIQNVIQRYDAFSSYDATIILGNDYDP